MSERSIIEKEFRRALVEPHLPERNLSTSNLIKYAVDVFGLSQNPLLHPSAASRCVLRDGMFGALGDQHFAYDSGIHSGHHSRSVHHMSVLASVA
ncbi:hypothetical protein DdX_07181 [Ditylenchus destructor]|uniref:Uncharacterized protein n=1 Tax=Ditylenchus destructor TaxID=166010 RepID=A0AAD4R5K3_9BILA|nr:hypothetical protein DdX_07181 [Ditylenchus destructor]